MSKIATDSVEATIRKTGDTHPAPRKPENPDEYAGLKEGGAA